MPLTAQHAGGVHRRRLCTLACAAQRARGVRLPIRGVHLPVRGVRIVLAALGLVVELDVRVAAALAVIVGRVCARQKKRARVGRRAVSVDGCRSMVGRVRAGVRRRARCVVAPHEPGERRGVRDAPAASARTASWDPSVAVDGGRWRRRAHRRRDARRGGARSGQRLRTTCPAAPPAFSPNASAATARRWARGADHDP